MSDSSSLPPHVRPAAPVLGDARLDAIHTEDLQYLGEFGYRQELRRVLGFFSSFAVQWTLIAVAGGMALSIGAGLIQVGPLTIWPWLIAGGLQMIVALAVAEAVSAYPLAGGSYNIINRIVGAKSAVGWHVGWWLIAAHIAAVGTEAYGLAVFYTGWFGVHPTGHWQIFGWALILIALSTLFNLVAVKIAAAFNNTVGVIAEFFAIAIVVVGAIVAVLFTNAHFHSLSYLTSSHGIVPHGSSAFLPFLFAMLVPTFVISGFDANGTAGEETTSASRTVPRALLVANFSTFAIGAILILFTTLLITNLHGTVTSVDPIRFVLASAVGPAPALTFEVLALLSLFVNMMILQLTAARVMFAQARDGQAPFPRALTKLTKEHVPYVAVLVSAVIAVLLIVYSGLLTVLLSMVAILWAAGYTVLVGVLIYARARGMLPRRPFDLKRWGYLIEAIAFVWSGVLCAILIKSNPKDIGWGFAGTIAIGIVIYFVFIPSKRRGILRDAREAVSALAEPGVPAAVEDTGSDPD